MVRGKAAHREAAGKSWASRGYARKLNTRESKPVILVICEGERTEPQYFEGWRKELGRSADVTLIVKRGQRTHATPSKLVDRALQEMSRESLSLADGDEVWCVFDTETPTSRPPESIRQAIALAEKRHFHVAVSNPCFEYWYLLHYHKTDRIFVDAAEVIRELEKHIKGYDKAMDAFACLGDRTEHALHNVRQLREANPERWEQHGLPSTNVDELVDAIRGASA